MPEEKKLTEKESLQLITEMIQKVKCNVHERGVSAILWGSAVAFAAFVTFAESYWNFYIGFDIWLIVLAALIPQAIISYQERKQQKVVTHQQAALNTIWAIYGISIFALLFYHIVVPGVSDSLIKQEGNELLMKNMQTGEIKHQNVFIPSFASLLLILYAIPTLATGIIQKYKPMLVGGILCYVFFIASCFTSFTYDWLLNGLAAICNWLIPGILLHKKYLKVKSENV
jgi:hypothetical protein